MKYQRAEIRSAFIAAHRLVASGCCTGAEVLRVMQPFHDCTGVEGISERLQHKSIGMIFALTADGYRVDKDFLVAAEWYRKASIYSSGHADLYRRMVCENHLTDYYEDALSTVQRADEEWRRRSFYSRISILLHQIHLWFDFEWIKLRLLKSRDLKFLLTKVPRSA